MANTAQRMEYVGGAAPTTLSGDLSDSGLQFNLADGTNYPTGTVGEFTLVINKGGATEEILLCDSRVNDQITVSPTGRGYSGTVASTHSAGESVAVCWSASAADADNLHNASTSGVHGVAGNVVGDTDAQTLANKVIDGSKNTLSNIPQSAVTGLSSTLTTSLAGKMGNPATAWAKGSLLVGTGAGTYDTEAVGASGAVLTAQADGSLAWKTVSAGLLGTVDYTSTSGYLSTSALTAVDTTNLSPSFTVPSSGKALIRVSGACIDTSGSSASTITLGWLNHSGGTQVGRSQAIGLPATSTSQYDPRFSVAQTLTGLSAGSTLQLDFAARTDGASVKLTDLTIEVWSA